MDQFCTKRDKSENGNSRIVAQLLTLIDGALSKEVTSQIPIFLFATAQNANLIDPAMRRPGRLDREWIIPIPDEKGRKEIIRTFLNGYEGNWLEWLDVMSEMTSGYSGSDLSSLCRHMILLSLKEIEKNEEKEIQNPNQKVTYFSFSF